MTSSSTALVESLSKTGKYCGTAKKYCDVETVAEITLRDKFVSQAEKVLVATKVISSLLFPNVFAAVKRFFLIKTLLAAGKLILVVDGLLFIGFWTVSISSQ
jgi:hypothetical protein